MSIEAMKQALEALEDGDHWERQEAITSIRQAIAEAEKQEFVSDPEKHPQFYTWTWDEWVRGGRWRAEYGWKKPERDDIANLQALYTSPPQRQPLTDEHKQDANDALRSAMNRSMDIAKQAAHGIKENNNG